LPARTRMSRRRCGARPAAEEAQLLYKLRESASLEPALGPAKGRGATRGGRRWGGTLCTPARFGRYLISYEPSPLSSTWASPKVTRSPPRALRLPEESYETSVKASVSPATHVHAPWDAACPLSTRGGTRLVRLVRGGGVGWGGTSRCISERVVSAGPSVMTKSNSPAAARARSGAAPRRKKSARCRRRAGTGVATADLMRPEEDADAVRADVHVREEGRQRHVVPGLPRRVHLHARAPESRPRAGHAPCRPPRRRAGFMRLQTGVVITSLTSVT
jgi:hypothetical protein